MTDWPKEQTESYVRRIEGELDANKAALATAVRHRDERDKLWRDCIEAVNQGRTNGGYSQQTVYGIRLTVQSILDEFERRAATLERAEARPEGEVGT